MATQEAPLRQRMREYRAADEYPQTPDDYDVPRWKQLAGTAIVAVVGFVTAAPFGLALLALNQVHPHPVWWFALLGLTLVATKIGDWVGAPVADHVLGIPREVSD